MLKNRILRDFKDIVEPRRINGDAVGFMMRHWTPQPAYIVNNFLTPHDVKMSTFESRHLNIILDELSQTMNKDRDELRKEVIDMLEEIGLDRKMFVVRSLGIFVTKVLCRVCSSVFVNERKIFGLKSILGSNPVVFVPTHRSYADFILMTYICFCYDIELPAVAAGMDFHAMVGMGRLMRDTCAFYIRRTFASDKVYSAVFRQYVRTLVTDYHAPLSFFIEGTRSRSQKSLSPKYGNKLGQPHYVSLEGFMSMVLEPLFTSEIPDVTFIPVNISYDRIMEERLFAFELLGVPKPKESTSGFFKALSILNENFGNIYVNFGEPLSAKEYFGKSLNRAVHAIKPIGLHTLTPNENRLVQKLSHEIVYQQQSIAVVTTFQLIAVAVNIALHNSKELSIEQLADEVIWLANLLKHYKAVVFDYDKTNIADELRSVLTMQNRLIRLDKDMKVRLLNTTQFILTEEIKQKMKGHQLGEKTMCMVIPIIVLQLYVNPVIHWLLPSAVIHLLISKLPAQQRDLLDNYKKMRMLLKYEFPTREEVFPFEFEYTLDKMKEFGIISTDGGEIKTGSDKKSHKLLEILIWPFVNCIYQTSLVLSRENSMEEKSLIKSIQKDSERDLINSNLAHPYCLALDTISNCIQGLVSEGCAKKEKTEKGTIYTADTNKLTRTSDWLKSVLFEVNANFDFANPVILNQTGIAAKL